LLLVLDYATIHRSILSTVGYPREGAGGHFYAPGLSCNEFGGIGADLKSGRFEFRFCHGHLFAPDPRGRCGSIGIGEFGNESPDGFPARAHPGRRPNRFQPDPLPVGGNCAPLDVAVDLCEVTGPMRPAVHQRRMSASRGQVEQRLGVDVD